MARQFNEVQQTVLDAVAASDELTTLQVLTPTEVAATSATSTSSVSLWRQWAWIIAFAIWNFEKVLDRFLMDVQELIAASRPHTKGWYRQKALDFQYGFELVPDTDLYDNTGIDEAIVTASKIVANAAAVKTIISGAGALRLKVVGTSGDGYTPLNETQVVALSDYMNEVSDAGTTVIVTSSDADLLKLEIDVYYDPQVLSSTGQMLDGSDPEPVLNAIRNYLKSLNFNGSLILRNLTSEIERLPGVYPADIRRAWSKYGSHEYTDYGSSFGEFTQIRVADSGWMILDEAQTVINYIPVID